MNGFVAGELVMNAAYYQRPVCEVCLSCKHERCVNTIDGCAEYRAAVAAHSRKYRRRNADDEKGAARGKDAAGVVAGG